MPLLPPPARPGPRLPRFLPAVGRSGPAWRFSSAAWPTPCSAPRIGPPPGCCSRTAATCSCRQAKAAAARSISTPATAAGARLADANLVAFELDRYDAIVVNHGGCGAMLKEYGLHWQDGLQPHRAKFAAKVKDVHEFLDALGIVPPGGRIEAVATYHDACHLAHAQGITAAPRRLLAKIPGPGAARPAGAGICCGSAGTYNLNEPAMSDRLAAAKMENILAPGQIVLAANAGCLLQIHREVRQQAAPAAGDAPHGTAGPELPRPAAVASSPSASNTSRISSASEPVRCITSMTLERRTSIARTSTPILRPFRG